MARSYTAKTYNITVHDLKAAGTINLSMQPKAVRDDAAG